MAIGNAVLVAQALQVHKHVQIEVEHVCFGPYRHAVVIGVVVVLAAALYGSQFQGYLVLVVVVAVIGTQPQEHAHLTALQRSGVGVCCLQLVGMGKELQVPVLAHVVLHVLVHGTGIVGTEVLHRQGQGLLVALH